MISTSTASAATIAYWEFDDGALADAGVGGATYTLTNNGYPASVNSATNLAGNFIANPDSTVGFVGDASANAGSFAGIPTTNHYVSAGANSAEALYVNGNAWTFEGWFNVNDFNGEAFFPIFNTRPNVNGTGLLFSVRPVDATTGNFNLFMRGNGDFTGFADADSNFALGTTYHFALTYNGSSNFELFLDGVWVDSFTTTVNLATIDNGSSTVL